MLGLPAPCFSKELAPLMAEFVKTREASSSASNSVGFPFSEVSNMFLSPVRRDVNIILIAKRGRPSLAPAVCKAGLPLDLHLVRCDLVKAFL